MFCIGAGLLVGPGIVGSRPNGKLCGLLRNLSNRTRLGDLPARLRAAAARLGTSTHGVHGCVFSALGGTGIADIRADGTKLILKPRVPREQSHAYVTYRRALGTETDAL